MFMASPGRSALSLVPRCLIKTVSGGIALRLAKIAFACIRAQSIQPSVVVQACQAIVVRVSLMIGLSSEEQDCDGAPPLPDTLGPAAAYTFGLHGQPSLHGHGAPEQWLRS